MMNHFVKTDCDAVEGNEISVAPPPANYETVCISLPLSRHESRRLARINFIRTGRWSTKGVFYPKNGHRREKEP